MKAPSVSRSARRSILGLPVTQKTFFPDGLVVWSSEPYAVDALLDVDVLDPQHLDLLLTLAVRVAGVTMEVVDGEPAYRLERVIVHFREGSWSLLEPLLGP